MASIRELGRLALHPSRVAERGSKNGRPHPRRARDDVLTTRPKRGPPAAPPFNPLVQPASLGFRLDRDEVTIWTESVLTILNGGLPNAGKSGSVVAMLFKLTARLGRWHLERAEIFESLD